MINNNLWWYGPHWLTSSESEWPKTNPLFTPKSSEVSSKSKLQNPVETVPISCLQKIVNNEDILKRVNGRLTNSLLPYSERFPIILRRDSLFCELYLSHLHKFLAHAECTLVCRMIQIYLYTKDNLVLK